MKNIILIIILSILVFETKGQTLQSVTDNGSTTTNRISINTGTEGLSLLGNSYLSFKDISNTSRRGYIQHDGSDLVLSPDLGTIRLYGKVGVGGVRAYDASTLHVKAPNSSPWAFLTEASTNQCIIGMSHTGIEGVIAVSYLDNSGFTPLQFMTSNIPRMSIATNGNVGIGTANVDNTQNWDKVLQVHGTRHAKFLVTESSGVKVGIFSHTTNNGKIGTESNHNLTFTAGYWNDVMTLTTAGNVGIGTLLPAEKLSVNGKIRAHEIKVETANWPDYVFAKDYRLPTLQETEKHIKEKGHLPGIPSAAEVKANGIDLGEMNAKLLQKIEEQTLYIIEQSKKLQEVIIRLERLESKK